MKKKVIAVLLSVVLAAGSIGTAPVLAAETTTPESVSLQQEESTEIKGEASEKIEELDSGLSDEGVLEEEYTQTEEEPVQEDEEKVDETVLADEQEAPDETAVTPEMALEDEVEITESVGEGEASAEIAKIEKREVIEEERERVEEEIVTAEENEAAQAEDVVDSGTCGENATWKLTGAGDNLTLTISGNGRISDFAFRDDYLYGGRILCPWYSKRGDIKEVIIEDGITAIGSNVFGGCNNLTSVALPDSLTDIGDYAFEDCVNLTSIMIPNEVTQIGICVFYNCRSLTSFTLPVGIKGLNEYTFFNCSSLTSVKLPDYIEFAGDYCFAGCSSLKSVTLGNRFKDICYGMFQGCSSLTSIIIPNSVTNIWDSAFEGCSSLVHITIPSSVTILGYQAFYAESMHADVYTVEGCAADKYFSSLNNGTTRVFTIHYMCDESSSSGHTYGDWVVTKEPNCKEVGIIEKTCKICGQKISDIIPISDDHVWSTGYTVDVDPTYDVEGIESIHCSICDRIKAGSERPVPRVSKPLNLITISGIENKIHSGEEQILDLVVIDGGTVLTEGTDYTVSYENNINVGIATVTVTGIGHYTGTYTNTFPILPAASSKVTCTNVASGIKVSWVKVEGATSYYVYRDSKLLFRTSALEVTDKEIKYDTGTKFTYRVIASAKGVGNSTKSRTAKMFRLMPVGIKTLTNPSAGKMTVTYDKCSGCYGYVVRYGLNKDMSDANVITIKGENTLSRTFAGMKKGKTYYVQVRTYMLEYGVRYYSGYCTTKTITIRK